MENPYFLLISSKTETISTKLFARRDKVILIDRIEAEFLCQIEQSNF